ncbi:hypothetical protein Tco_0190806 [Tanacetum coccineum]
MVPRAVLMKSGLVSVNNARQVNAAHTKTTVNAARPMVNIVKDKNVNTVRPKAVVNAARPKAVVNVVKGNNVNAKEKPTREGSMSRMQRQRNSNARSLIRQKRLWAPQFKSP